MLVGILADVKRCGFTSSWRNYMTNNVVDAAVGMVTSVPIAAATTSLFTDQQVAYFASAVSAILVQLLIAFCRRKGLVT